LAAQFSGLMLWPVLILSGLLATQVDDVAAAYIAEGLVEVRRDTQTEWASVEFIQPDHLSPINK